MTSNTVTISASCLSTLPPGEYHYSLFEGIDIFKPAPEKTVEDYQVEIAELNDELEAYKKEIAELEEELDQVESRLKQVTEPLRGLKDVLGNIDEY